MCLREYIGKGILSNPGEKQYFECPLCRSKTYAKDNSDTKNWVEDFPSNHFIVSMIDDGLQTLDQTDNSKMAKKQMQCVPCSIDGKTGKKSNAFAFCTVCTEYLCKECNQNHGKFKATRSHLVLTGDRLPKDISAFEKMSQYGFCDIHNQKEIEFKCFDHDKFVCSLCVASSHRKCDYLVHIDNIDSKNTTTFQENVDRILSLKTDVVLALSSKLEEAEKLDKEEARIDKNKRELIDILKDEIMHLETDFTETYRQLIKEAKKKLSISISESAGLIDTIKSLGELATVVLKHGSKHQMTILCDELRTRERSITSCTDSKGSTTVATLEKCVLKEISKIRSKLPKLCGYEELYQYRSGGS